MKMNWCTGTLVLFAVSAAVSTGFAQSDDHLVLDQAKSLYAQSVFAHGYRHGYEEGFHIGDQDLQMGRRVRICEKISEYKQGRTHFRATFGDKSAFERGYKQGFSRGYEDAFSGREFQAVKSGRIVALGLDQGIQNTGQSHAFDTGFASGYDLAMKNALHNVGGDLEYLTQHCEKTADPKLKDRETYCQGYARGLVFAAVQSREDNSEMARSLLSH
jgi:flagellar biosynthesis/type III secretory pathway protein FliH